MIFYYDVAQEMFTTKSAYDANDDKDVKILKIETSSDDAKENDIEIENAIAYATFQEPTLDEILSESPISNDPEYLESVWEDAQMRNK